MSKKQSTPEEQLLNLIEKGEGFKGLKPKRKKFFPFNAAALPYFFPRVRRLIKSNVIKLKTVLKEPNLKVVNKCLAVISLTLLSYWLIEITLRSPDVEHLKKQAPGLGQSRFTESQEKDVRTFLYYLEMVQRRNIFQELSLRTAENVEVEAREVLASVTGGLSLVGISWGVKPQAMIEDKNENKTLFLNEGDYINNKLKIDTILKDRVILDYDGMKVELM